MTGRQGKKVLNWNPSGEAGPMWGRPPDGFTRWGSVRGRRPLTAGPVAGRRGRVTRAARAAESPHMGRCRSRCSRW